MKYKLCVKLSIFMKNKKGLNTDEILSFIIRFNTQIFDQYNETYAKMVDKVKSDEKWRQIKEAQEASNKT